MPLTLRVIRIKNARKAPLSEGEPFHRSIILNYFLYKVQRRM